MKAENRQRALHAALALVALAAFAFAGWARLAATLREPLWLDEAYSAYAAGHDLNFLWRVVPRYETHPPFYYTLLHVWSGLFGNGLLPLRALGVAAGLLTLPAAAFAARAFGRWLGWSATARAVAMASAVVLAALSPALVEMAREVRPYPLLILAYTLGLAGVAGVGRHAREGRLGARSFALYLVALALVLWLHNLGPLFGGSLGLGLLLAIVGTPLGRREWVRIVVGHLVVALVWLPALLILADQAPTWIHKTWLTFSWAYVERSLPLLWAAPEQRAWLPGGVLMLLGAGRLAAAEGPAGRRALGVLLVAGVLPVAASVAASVLVAPVFISRTLTPVASPALLLAALGVAGPRGLWRWVALFALAAYLPPMIARDIRARAFPPREKWYDAVEWLSARYRPGDEVWAYPNEAALPLGFALRDRGIAMTVRAIPQPVPALDVPGGWYPTGSRGVASLPRPQLEAIARTGARVPTIWLLRMGANSYDVGDVFLHVLHDDRDAVARFRKLPIELTGLRRREVLGTRVTPGLDPR